MRQGAPILRLSRVNWSWTEGGCLTLKHIGGAPQRGSPERSEAWGRSCRVEARSRISLTLNPGYDSKYVRWK
jgi:hypothetical protein